MTISRVEIPSFENVARQEMKASVHSATIMKNPEDIYAAKDTEILPRNPRGQKAGRE